jgi:hypothetical protein
MRHVINGEIVEIFTNPDGSIQSDALWEAGNIPEDRALMLQIPGGGNRLINYGERLTLSGNQYFREAPRHDRGFTAANEQRLPPVHK